MGSQPIRIQLRKILQENLAGQGGGEKANLISIQLRKILLENLAGKSCGKILWENLAGKYEGTGWRGKSQFKKGSDW